MFRVQQIWYAAQDSNLELFGSEPNLSATWSSGAKLWRCGTDSNGHRRDLESRALRIELPQPTGMPGRNQTFDLQVRTLALYSLSHGHIRVVTLVGRIGLEPISPRVRTGRSRIELTTHNWLAEQDSNLHAAD